MSGFTERFSATVEDNSILDLIRAYYHVPLLFLAVLFSLWVRTRGWRNFVTDQRVLFSGNDAWYHLRTVTYTVKNWPFTMPFEPWTYYPYGTSSGQFGTLYDQIVATVALAVGLGSPTPEQIAMTHLFAPAVFGALTLVPAYFFAKRLSDRNGGLVAVLLLALTTGQFLTRGVVGFSDHHIAEVFFLTLAAYGVVTALAIAEKEKPVYELATARDWDALRRPVGWGAIAGVFLATYLLTWPPGVFLVGVIGVFFAIAMPLDKIRGRSPDHIAIPGVTMGVVAGVVTLLMVDVVQIAPVKNSLIQPLFAFGLAAGCAFLAALARVWDDRGISDAYYPLAILGIFLAGMGLLAVAAPGFFDYMVGQVLRIFGYDATAQTRTVAEAQPIPLDEVAGFLAQSYGLAVYTAVVGVALLLYDLLVADDARSDHLFLLVLTVFLFMATLTQRRFDYYLAIPVAALNGYVAVVVFDLVDLDDALDSAGDVKAYQVLAVLAVLLLVAAPLTIGARTAPNVAQQRANPGEVQGWTGSLDWMQENTPVEGAYGTGGEQSLEYYGTYDRTDDFDYEEGTYGVMAWWDYGHWITVLGERIPNANPFQQGATAAANALLAPNESAAEDVMTHENGEDTRYVMIDYQLGLAGTRKFTAPTVFEDRYGISNTDSQLDNDVTRTIFNPQNGRAVGTIHAPRSYESLRVRLYQFHGSAVSLNDFQTVQVIDYDTRTVEGQTYFLVPEDGQLVKEFPNASAAQQFVEQDGSAQIGGLPGRPSQDLEALQHYRLVHAGERMTRSRTTGQPYSHVKTFERVPGATVEGQGPANETVTARVRMRIPTTNQTFTYEQRARTGADGSFTMTLPYSTAGYDRYGTDAGYTNVSVRADTEYSFTTPATEAGNGSLVRYTGSAPVTEGQVLGENETAVRVELTRESVSTGEGNETNGTSDGPGGTTDSPDGANGTNTTGSTNDSGGANDSGGETGTDDGSASMAPPRHAARAR